MTIRLRASPAEEFGCAAEGSAKTSAPTNNGLTLLASSLGRERVGEQFELGDLERARCSGGAFEDTPWLSCDRDRNGRQWGGRVGVGVNVGQRRAAPSDVSDRGGLRNADDQGQPGVLTLGSVDRLRQRPFGGRRAVDRDQTRSRRLVSALHTVRVIRAPS
jgi:hypothetical protein